MFHKRTTKNLLILMRHGERCDKVNMIPTFHQYDPELSPKGKEQAFQIGELLSEYLKKNYSNYENININSSPFGRTIQTSKYLLNGLRKTYDISNSIDINYYFSEYMASHLFESYDFPTYIVILNNFKKLTLDLENTNLNVINKPEGIISTNFEDIKTCSERLVKGLDNLYENEFKENNLNIFFVVSHAEPINLINQHLKYPGELGWENIKYCRSYIYEVEFNLEENNFCTNYIDSLYPPQN